MVAKPMTAASGTPATAITYVRADESIERVGAVHLGDRLIGVALLIATILVHGAATVSLGLAVATVIERRRLALSVTIGLSVLLVLGVPLYLFMTNPSYAPVFMIWGFVMVADSLLAMLSTRVTDDILTMSHWVAVWNVVVLALCVGLLWFTIRTWQRRLLGVSKSHADTEIGSEESPPVVEAALIGD